MAKVTNLFDSSSSAIKTLVELMAISDIFSIPLAREICPDRSTG
ncbi:MAG TPA: hypothetical protein PKL29_10255 [Methanothrix sp.]|nr:hypothetical protein [Methanothrix sp.]